MDLFSLDRRTAVVTGGMGRLGSRYARALSAAGASVAIFDRVSAPSPIVKSLIDSGQNVAAYAVDVTNREAVDSAMNDVMARFGTPTILLNNAGLAASPATRTPDTCAFERYPESAWDEMMESHLKSAFIASQSFLAHFRSGQQDTGSIINISSTYGLVTPDQSMYEYRRRDGSEYFKPIGYSVAKSGMLNFTRWLAEYCASFGVRVNTLVPGGVQEPGHPLEFVEEYAKRTMLGRMANDDDYNGAILFLASRASAYMTGAMLVVDGGWTAR
jgi:NAD(P)-dependent dehydrogenase (short-subunit alcohol dehydrogenase family)